jgi:uncharacterized membrane protein
MSLNKKQISEILSSSMVEEVEGEGLDDGRFFVHLKNGFDWKTDAEVRRTKSFSNITAVKKALKNAGSINITGFSDQKPKEAI